MKFTYDFANGQAKMICTPEINQVLDERVWSQLNGSAVSPYLVPVQAEGQGKAVKLIYSLGGLINLLAWKEEAPRKEIKKLSDKMDTALQNLNSIFMPQEYILLDERYLYMDENSGNLRMICVPFIDEALVPGFRDDTPVLDEKVPEPSFGFKPSENSSFSDENDVTRGFIGSMFENNEDDVTRGYFSDSGNHRFSEDAPTVGLGHVHENENQVYRGYGAFGSIGSGNETGGGRYASGPSRGSVTFMDPGKTESITWKPTSATGMPAGAVSFEEDEKTYSWNPAPTSDEKEVNVTEKLEKDPDGTVSFEEDEKTYSWNPTPTPAAEELNAAKELEKESDAVVSFEENPDSDGTVALQQQVVMTAGFTRCKNGDFYEITERGALIGRDVNQCDIGLTGNPAINGVHCRITYGYSFGFNLEDLGSLNGTWIDGAKVKTGEEVRLFNGSRIQIADEKFIFEIF